MNKNRSNVGILIVMTGASGSGKDLVMNKFLGHSVIETLNIKRVITCTDRPIRDNEPADAYRFLSKEELDRLAAADELVEPIVDTGTSRKATSKAEIARLLSGENLFWRIDPSRAAEIAKGNFFDKHFKSHAKILKTNTLVICINAPKDVIEERRKRREGKKYNPDEFALRDLQEAPHLDVLLQKATVVDNFDGKLEQTVETVVTLISKHYAKIKNQKI